MVRETIGNLKKEIEKLTLENNELKEKNLILEKKCKNNKSTKNKNEKNIKKNKSAYLFFYLEELNKYKEINPNKKIKITEIHKQLDLSNKWNEIKNNEKVYKIYKNMEENDKERYLNELKSNE